MKIQDTMTNAMREMTLNDLRGILFTLEDQDMTVGELRRILFDAENSEISELAHITSFRAKTACITA